MNYCDREEMVQQRILCIAQQIASLLMIMHPKEMKDI